MLIYFSPVSWNDFDQRPHEFVRAFYRVHKEPVVWIEPYPTRLPSINDFFRRNLLRTENSEPEWLKIIRPHALPIEPIFPINQINKILFGSLLSFFASLNSPGNVLVIGKPSLLALLAVRRLNEVTKLYDAMDDFPLFYTGISMRSMKKTEFDVASSVDMISVSSTCLHQKFSSFDKNVVYLPNACSEQVRHLTRPEKASRRPANKQLTMGYVGTIAAWFDWKLIMKLARDLPAARIVLIGPIHGALPRGLPGNVEIRPAVSHDQAIMEMAQFDYGLIPFLDTPLTRAVDPIKYYEYTLLNLPIISTRFGEMNSRGHEKHVFLVDQDQDFSFVNNIHDCSSDGVDTSRYTWNERFDCFFREVIYKVN